MDYGLNAYLSPDMKLASTIIGKPFRNLGATVVCEGTIAIQDAFNIQRCVIRFMPILCSLQHHKWYVMPTLILGNPKNHLLPLLQTPCPDMCQQDKWQHNGAQSTVLECDPGQLTTNWVCLTFCLDTGHVFIFTISLFTKKQLCSHQILKDVKGALSISTKSIRNTCMHLNSQSYQ